MSGVVVATNPAEEPNDKALRHHGQLSESQDLLADLSVDEPLAKAVAVSAAGDGADDSIAAACAIAVSEGTTVEAVEVPAAVCESADLTPEQDAAAAQCAEDFVGLYEHAWLTRAVHELEAACAAKDIPESAVAKKLRGRGINLQDLKERAAEVERGLAECASDEGWRLVQDGKLRLLYRHQAGSTIHSFKGSCCLPAPMEQPLSMAREFDLVNSWNSYITNSKILRTYCDVDLLVYASVWFPWPFVERDVLISAVADDRLRDDNVVAVSFASPRGTPAGVEPDLPAGADQRVHIYFTSGSCMTMRPVPAPPATVTVQSSSTSGEPAQVTADSNVQQTEVVIVANIETGLAHVPEAIVQFVLKVFAPFFYSAVLKVLHSTFDDPSQALPQRMVQHHELYDMIRQRIQDYLDGHPD